MKKKRLFLIDGNSFCYRAYYAIRSLTTSKGQPTNAVYGFVAMLNKIIKEEAPDLLAICFDLKGPTFRHKKYEKYKIHRKPMPDDLVSQIPIIKKMITAYNIPIFELEGYEADDVLATIAKKAASSQIEAYIATSDKDALQIVNDCIKVYNASKGIVYDSKMVKSKYGVGPEKITDLMALMGDASDNIPGITGIGEKGAVELLHQFGSLDNVLSNLKDIKSASKRSLIEAGIDQARLSKDLATIDVDVPIEVDIEELKLKEPDRDSLIELFRALEFKNLLRELIPSDELKSNYTLIDSSVKLEELIRSLEEQNEFVFDFETTHYDPMLAEPVGVSFSWKEGQACYVPFNLKKELNSEKVLAKMKDVFEDPKVKKIGQNIKYDYIILKNMGIEAKGIHFDTMVASYLINPSKMNHNLGDLSIEYINHRMTPIEELIGKGKKAITMDKVEIDKVVKYGCGDSDVTLRLKYILEKILSEKALENLFFNIEMPLVEVLALMEIQGVGLDVKYLKRISKEMEQELDKYKKEIYKLASVEFNINSPKQLQEVLFQRLKLPIVRRTKTGPSTDERVLRALAKRHDLPRKILKYREFSKLKSTYVDALPNLINPKTGRIHTSFNQTVTQTGRLSSSNPNIQNIPIKTDEGRKIRRAFVSSPGDYVLLSADYSQIELRVLAHQSGDNNLIKAFNEEKDIHRFTASLVYDVDEKDVTSEMRDSAKTVNFGIIYGMSPFGLSQDLNIDIEEAKEFIENYFKRYPDVKAYLEDKIREAQKRKYVTTIMERRRYIPEITSADVRIRNFAERTAINAPIQGSAADIIKLAMIKIHKDMVAMKSKMILQVHDELVFDVSISELEKVARIVKSGMEDIVKLKVPLKVNLKSGKNWLDTEGMSI